MALKSNEWLVDTEWLATRINAPDIVVFDASWHMPETGRNAREEYMEAHIPGALFFDIDEIADLTSPLPHMLPPPEKFSSRMRRMGVGDGCRIVIYDTHGLYSAARVWWTFRVMGATDVAVLDGGLKKWRAENRAIEDGPPAPRFERHFTSRRNGELVRDSDDVMQAVLDNSAQIVDARSPGRFSGAEPEPRAGLRSGHMPGARNLHYATLINEDGTLKDANEAARIFGEAGVDIARPVIATCGSGVSAAIIALSLATLGNRHTAVYDGSWVDWGANPSLPVESDVAAKPKLASVR
jgi:thiosulfate/3-mercaptopyruvate sulfurtransferase